MLKLVADLIGADGEDNLLLHKMADEALSYIRSFTWCPPIKATYLAYGIGGIIAVFLVKFDEKIQGTDDCLWVIVGDLPSAYIVVEPQDSAREALERYCQLMDDWIKQVREKGDFKDAFPISVERTTVNADLLRSRVNFILDKIIPQVPIEIVND